MHTMVVCEKYFCNDTYMQGTDWDMTPLIIFLHKWHLQELIAPASARGQRGAIFKTKDAITPGSV